MTRPIKFRAWDGGKMHQIVQMLWGHEMSNEPLSVDFFDSTRPKLLSDVSLMQFTGLHDKNGKEIYEGDVVKYKYNDEFAAEDSLEKDWNGTSETRVAEVKFHNGTFDPIDEGSYPEDGYYGWRNWDFEVIGNIYENPELIQQI